MLPPWCSIGCQILRRQDLPRISQIWWFLKPSMTTNPRTKILLRPKKHPPLVNADANGIEKWGITNSNGFSSFIIYVKLLYRSIQYIHTTNTSFSDNVDPNVGITSGNSTLLLNMATEVLSVPMKMVIFHTYVSLPEGGIIHQIP